MISLLTRRALKTVRRTRPGKGASTTSTRSTSTTSTLGPTLPWIAGPPLYLAGGVLGRWVVTDPVWDAFWGGLVLLTSVGTAWVAWLYAEGHKSLQRAHVAASIAVSPLALLIPMWWGVNRWTGLALLPVWVAYCATWQARVSPAVLYDGEPTTSKGDTVSASLGLDGLTVSGVVLGGTPGKRPDRIASRWHVGAPQGYADIAKKTTEIKNWAGAYFVRAARVDDDPRAADLLVVLRDTLRDVVPYVHAPVGSMFDSIRIGTRIDGTEERFTVATSEGFGRVMVAGCSGSGKTRTAWVIWAALSQVGAVWWIADPVKGGQSVGPAASLFGRIATDPDETTALLADLRTVIKNRSKFLGSAQEWSPGCGLAPLVVWFEEAAGVTSDGAMGKELTRIAEACRSVGILLVISQQRPSSKNMNTDAREQFTTSLCHGVQSPETKKMVLSESTIAAGACPEQWLDMRKGYHFAEDAGTPSHLWADPCRSLLISPEQLADAVRRSVTGVLLPREIEGTTLVDGPASAGPSRLNAALDEVLGESGVECRVRTADLLAACSPDDDSRQARDRLRYRLRASDRVQDDGKGWWIITR